ncbi:protein WFDC9 [Phyllostomus discolor]|uniref:Protein WFDC9 n=1 Tax=Phyllostomus discolor TaxID=89673 RepID=A0A7E6CGM8_9CHIR|nr:protein WFDC9 [Phyllostomus discolor]
MRQPWGLLLILCICGLKMLRPVLGSIRNKLLYEVKDVKQCWVQPPPEYCAKRCNKLNGCIQSDHTCCWTFCGNICLHDE